MIKKMSKKGKIVFITAITMVILLAVALVLYVNFHGISSKLKIELKGKEKITLEVGEEYKEQGASASYNKKDISKNLKIIGNVNTQKIGAYKVTYKAKYKKVSKTIIRNIKVVDKTAPIITLVGENINVIIGQEYQEPGYSVLDNYDGDITVKVTVTNNININELGEYEVVYKVLDSSNNENTITRKVNVIQKPKTTQKIAVLNYHFFYDPSLGETCDESICERVSDFKEQLNYLKQNNYKTLTMREFRDWMYGAIEIPDKSVLITIDDGAMGTGAHNGNKLIPILEEYKMHATLFLITGWWDINNYRSEYLDIESHTHDMHTGNLCSGVSRGAQMLCSSNEQVLNDLKTSMGITKSNLAFCFPFYAYNENAIGLVKQVGFQLAFIGGGTKVSRATDKYHIPRYPIQKTTSLQTFINYVS